jgi:hypothetical protein
MHGMSKSNGKDRHEADMEKKFADFDRTVAEAKSQGIQAVLVPSPQTPVGNRGTRWPRTPPESLIPVPLPSQTLPVHQ